MSDSRFHGVFSSLLKEKGLAFGGQTEEVISDEASQEEAQMEEVPVVDKSKIPVDVFEDGSYVIVKALLAGVKLSDVDIDVADNKIVIRGVREQTDDLKDSKVLVEENYYGEFEREVELPFAINASKVRATFSKDSILKVFVPREERKVKIVKVNEGG
ncbi:Hsp20/alpha crystallin family protein [Candidatus Peribacteria bacterium]|jgi:HSP20 family molecular chaperone IbpA|nr:Hsp20/alpha crystallin family protein [Candidatus Peribacteria bacterium]MBT4021283.1 Hsp20/alpha crystallin family protein [Candidatus Peribacteria bacterium]MBT4240344.1 Hsp20/alpha crystallin family protein [Candidatus Peribacteria bacterium]MBT4474059.1 Hsp20/alpha crystallin family protein [Candidatus Peribacteria bacterium]